MSKPGGAFSRLGLLCGILSLTAVLISFVSGSWLYTNGPILLPNSTQLSLSLGITIGLWTVCPYVKKTNTSIHFTSPTCSSVKYKNWDDAEYSTLGVSNTLEVAQIITSKIKYCTLLCGVAIILIILAIILALLGCVNNDRKILVACGLFIFGGLSLGAGLVIFVTYVTETLTEVSHYDKQPHFVYHYGWCFYLGSTTFPLANIAALFSILGYMSTFPTVDEMVKHTVPGGQRKLQQYSYEKELTKHAYSRAQYDALSRNRLKLKSDDPVCTYTPPDVCSTSYCPPSTSGVSSPVNMNYNEVSILIGQTVPITIKSQNINVFSSSCVMEEDAAITSQCPYGVEDIETFNPNKHYGSNALQHKNTNYIKSDIMQVFEPTVLNFSRRKNDKYCFGSAV